METAGLCFYAAGCHQHSAQLHPLVFSGWWRRQYAGMDLSVQGANGIIFAFALWGSAQLVYAIIQLLVAFRYRSLIPFMYILLIVETLLRMLVGKMRPVSFAHTPPGALGNYVILPVAVIVLVIMLWSANRDKQV